MSREVILLRKSHLEWCVQVCSQYKRDGMTGESRANGREDDGGLEYLSYEKRLKERAGTVQLGEKKLRGDLINVYKYLRDQR